MNRNQQKEKKKSTAYLSDPALLSQPRDGPQLCCLNNLWVCDPPPQPQLKFELQNKYLSCFGAKFESSLLLFSLNSLFENQLYGSVVPLIVAQGTVGSFQTRCWRAGQSSLAQ